VLKDLKRFQGDKEDDLRRYMVGLSQLSIVYAVTYHVVGQLCTLPHRLGQEELRDVGRGQGRGRKDRRAMI